MANEEHLALLKQGVEVWNEWRHGNDSIEPDLTQAHLFQADLTGADLTGADLTRANLSMANLRRTNLSGADLSRTHLSWTNLTGANLTRANLSMANLRRTNLRRTNLSGADLSRTHLSWTNLTGANLSWTNLTRADLSWANLTGVNLLNANLTRANLIRANLTRADLTGANLLNANLSGADLSGANLLNANLSGADVTGVRLTGTQLVLTNLTNANLTGCHIYGVSAWSLKLEGAQQKDLIITPKGEPVITVDNLEVAQFIYLLLHNEKIRNVIDTLGKKAVLILDRFTPERKPGLDAIRDALRNYNYLPVMFDFQKPESQDFIQPVSTLAHLSRFVIADVTDPKIILEELPHIVRNIPIPVIPLLLEGSLPEPSTLLNLRVNHLSVLPTYWYQSPASLLASLKEKVIDPAEAKVEELLERKIKLLSSS